MEKNILDDFKFPVEIARDIAAKEKKRRKERKLTQAELGERAGVSLASLKRFEQTGQISFVSLLKLAAILDQTDAFTRLFDRRQYRSIQEVIDERNR